MSSLHPSIWGFRNPEKRDSIYLTYLTSEHTFPFVPHASSPSVFPITPVRLANHFQCRRVCLHSLSGASSHLLRLTHTLHNTWTMTSCGERHNHEHLGIPQQIVDPVSSAVRPRLLDIYRKPLGDSALFQNEWGSLQWESNERTCMYEQTEELRHFSIEPNEV